MIASCSTAALGQVRRTTDTERKTHCGTRRLECSSMIEDDKTPSIGIRDDRRDEAAQVAVL